MHQHWVPQFYLRYFATPSSRESKEPQVWIFSSDEQSGDEKLVNVRKVCGKRYMYAPKDKSGNRDWRLDDKLERIESAISEIWSDVAEDFIDLADPRLRRNLSLFVATMRLRSLSARNGVEELHGQLVRAFEAFPKKPDGTPNVVTFEHKGVVREFDTSNRHEWATGDRDHDRIFAHSIDGMALNIAEHLLKKRWTIITSEVDVFVTSDTPVVLTHASRSIFGVSTPGVEVLFPLGPKRLLIMDDKHGEPSNQYYPLMESLKGAFNLTLWGNASRWMITGRPVSEVLQEILDFGDSVDLADSSSKREGGTVRVRHSFRVRRIWSYLLGLLNQGFGRLFHRPREP